MKEIHTHHVLFHHSQKDTKVNFPRDWKHFLDFVFLSWKSKDSQANLRYTHNPSCCYTVSWQYVLIEKKLFLKKWSDQYPCDVDGPCTVRVKEVESCLHVPHLHLGQLHLDSFSALLQHRAASGSSSARTRSLEDKVSVHNFTFSVKSLAPETSRKNICSVLL